MTKTLDVLLIESEPGDGEADADRLEAAGHRVHRCRSETGPRRFRAGRLCVGVTDLACPLDRGIDVALLVRSRVAPQPLGSEAGASCALRTGLPLIEDGPDGLDPFEPWLTGPTGDDVVASCEDAAQRACDRLRALIRHRLRPVLLDAGVDLDDVEVDFAVDHSRLAIHLRGPVVSSAVQETLGVRVLDAVRLSGHTFSYVDVSYHPIDP